MTTYNNYYEFGTDKEQPSRLASTLTTEPWTVVVEGECNRPAVYHLEDVLKGRTLETLMFNGYRDQVAGLYAGMDLRKNF